MSYAINKTAILSVKAEPTKGAEMTAQLWFGERCQIIGEKDNWLKIKNCHDGHIGWVTKSDLEFISEEENAKIAEQPLIRVCVPMADVFCLSDKTIYRLTMGSIIPNYDEKTSKFSIGEQVFQVHPSFITYLPGFNRDGIVPTAMSLMNTPYMDSGKNIFGMNCSGFAQTVFAVNGYVLPRRCAMQKETGIDVNLTEIEVGDLIFFDNESHTSSHTSIYIGENRIIHSNGKVRITHFEYLDNFSILINELKYTISAVRRVL